MNSQDNEIIKPRVHWKFPDAAKFGRIIPKDKLYEQVGANVELKQLFVDQVAQITWAYKLANNTINLAKTAQVQELEVIQLKLKGQSIDDKVLSAIDSAIPHPTLFILLRDLKTSDPRDREILVETLKHEIAYQAAHKIKTTTQTNKEKWRQSAYLQSQWLKPHEVPPVRLPIAIDLGGLYSQIIEALLPDGVRDANTVKEPVSSLMRADIESTLKATENSNQERLQAKLDNLEAIKALNKQIKQTKAKRDKEKQFNRKRELNDQLKELKQRLIALQCS